MICAKLSRGGVDLSVKLQVTCKHWCGKHIAVKLRSLFFRVPWKGKWGNSAGLVPTMISWLKKHISFPQPRLYKRADEHSWVYYSKNILTNCGVKDQENQTKNIKPHLPSGPIHPYQLEESISNFREVCRTFSFLFYFECIFMLANSEDPDQTPRSDLGLHCLPMS